MVDRHDYVALEWVKGDIAETLKQARSALDAFVETHDSDAIAECLAAIHQVHGALQMVEFYGAALLAEEIEELTLALQAERVGQRDESIRLLQQALSQLPLYLDRVHSARRDLPLVVLPLLNDLRSARGESLLSETSLFSPQLLSIAPLPDEALAQRAVPELHEQLHQWHKLLQQALLQYPDDLNLLYTRAMQAEKRNDLAQMEKDLRLIIKRDPDNAMALNALGYTLSDRTTRYAEAKVLIEQAHKLNPEDPAVLDSLGWVNYRLGNLDEAERLLRQALERFPDQEVAAHLGEVLWANGKQREARQIWEKFLKEQPESPILRGTIKRLTGSETL